MTEVTKLSPVMRECRHYMAAHGGKIRRHPGGFWAHEKWVRGERSYGTTTVQALVSRGFADYSVWKQGRGARFPIEATLLK